MSPLSRTVTTAAVTVVLLGPLGTARGQGRGPLSPEVTADRRIVLRLQAPNAKAVQVQGDFTAKTHDMTKDDKGVWSYTSEPLKPGSYQYYIHKEGTQASIRRVTDALDAERVAVREALGYGAPHFPLADHYREDGEEWMYGRKAHAPLVKSGDWRERIVLTEHRYMREDVAEGLAFLVSVADWAGVRAPVAKGLLALGSAVCGQDFRATGRTLEALGLALLSRQAVAKLLAEDP